jgi:hypothetical protein
LIGVDVDPRCAQFDGNGIEIVIGDQEDRAFLRALRERVQPADVVIDDGGHTMKKQIATFEEMLPAIADGGIYLVEDLHTSYWREFGGGYRKRGTFIEYSKTIVDKMHAWHHRRQWWPRPRRRLEVDAYTRQIKGMHVYDSIIAFDVDRVSEPTHERIGVPRLQ